MVRHHPLPLTETTHEQDGVMKSLKKLIQEQVEMRNSFEEQLSKLEGILENSCRLRRGRKEGNEEMMKEERKKGEKGRVT